MADYKKFSEEENAIEQELRKELTCRRLGMLGMLVAGIVLYLAGAYFTLGNIHFLKYAAIGMTSAAICGLLATVNGAGSRFILPMAALACAVIPGGVAYFATPNLAMALAVAAGFGALGLAAFVAVWEATETAQSLHEYLQDAQAESEVVAVPRRCQ